MRCGIRATPSASWVRYCIIYTEHRKTYSSSIPERLVIILVRDRLRGIDGDVSCRRVLDANHPGAAFSERSGHVVGEQVSTAALAWFAKAEATDAFVCWTRLAGEQLMIYIRKVQLAGKQALVQKSYGLLFTWKKSYLYPIPLRNAWKHIK